MTDTRSDNKLGAMDHVGEVSDLLGLGGQFVQGLDLGHSIFGQGGNLLGGGFMPGTTRNLAEGAGTVSPLFNETLGVQRGFNGLGGITGAISAVQGTQDMIDPTKSMADRIAGGANLFSGGIGAIGGLIGTIAPQATGFLGGLANAGGTMGMGATVLGEGGGAAWGMGAGAAGIGTALSTAAAVVGAGTAGYGLGRYGDKNAENLDWLRDKKGRNRSISDWGSDLAVRADEGVADAIGGEQGSWQRAIGGKLGTLAGGTTAVATSIAGVPLAIGSTAVGLDNALGGVPSQVLAGMTGGLSTQIGKGMGGLVDLAHWMTD